MYGAKTLTPKVYSTAEDRKESKSMCERVRPPTSVRSPLLLDTPGVFGFVL